MGLYLKTSIAFLLCVCFLGIASIQYIIIQRKKIDKRYIYIIIIINIILILGSMYIKCIDCYYENVYESISNLGEISMEAIVISSAKDKEYSNTYEIKVLNINESEKYKGIHLILNMKKNKEKGETIEFGDKIEIIGAFQVPNEARNFRGFNYKRYLKGQKIHGTIETNTSIKIIEKDKCNFIHKTIYFVQNSIKRNIEKTLSKETAELCIGILIGNRENLEKEVEENFKTSNLTHMLAVSGAHISYIILGVTITFRKMGKKFSKIVVILFLVFFMALTNFTPSVTRASIMAILVLLSELFHRKADIYNNLALSTFIILIKNPYTILDIGFQLSYAGTIGIVLLNEKISNFIQEKKKAKSKILQYIITSIIITISANILIIPIMIYQFNTISFTFWISNLLASPLMGIVIILGFITYFISIISINLAKIIAIPLNLSLFLLLRIAELCSKIPFSSILVKTPYMVSIIIYYSIIMIVINLNLVKRKIKKCSTKIIKRIKKIKVQIYQINKTKRIIMAVMLSILIMIFLLMSIYQVKQNENLKIFFIDVGQGDSTLIVTPTNKKILIDGGGSESFDVGDKTLIPYLLDRRIKELDYILISHFDTDHVRTEY